MLARWPTRAVEPEKTEHAEPEDILAAVAEKERRIIEMVGEMRELVMAENCNAR